MGDEEPVMNLAFVVHAIAAPGFPHEFGEAMFEHAGANAAEDVFPAVLLEHNGVDALEVQQLRQQQARRTTADNANLNLHRALPFRPVAKRKRVIAEAPPGRHRWRWR